MRITIKDVAQRAGVSVVTVSRVINGVSTVREKNRKKVLKAMAELNYSPSSAARTLSKGETGVIGLMVAHIADSFINELVTYLSEYLEQKGYFLALSILPEGEFVKRNYLFTPDRTDGIILLASKNERDYVTELKSRNIPVVIINNNYKYSHVSTVSVDNFKGGYLAAKHLLKLGHRKIAHVSGPKNLQSSCDRQAGFIKALKENGFEPFELIAGNYTIEAGYKAAIRWVEGQNLPDAVFAADDLTAFGLIDGFREKGLQVPDDIAIVGYDNHPFSYQLHPFLTTIKQPTKKLAVNSVELLLEQLRSSNKRAVNLVLKPELLVRESTMHKELTVHY